MDGLENLFSLPSLSLYQFNHQIISIKFPADCFLLSNKTIVISDNVIHHIIYVNFSACMLL